MAFPDTFAPTGTSELDKNADLTLYLLDHLAHQRTPDRRIWEGEQPLLTVQYTSQAIEALHDLGLKGITDQLAEPAAEWLLGLPFGHDLSPAHLRELHLYPGRFKALARVGKFDPGRLAGDFSALSLLLDPDTGWIQDAPLDIPPVLITMMWVDTLIYLEPLGPLDPAMHTQRDRALRAVGEAFDAWADTGAADFGQDEPPAGSGSSGNASTTEIVGLRAASYALDLLTRSGALQAGSPRAEQATQRLARAIRQCGAGRMRQSEYMYCGLHLSGHLRQQAGIRAVIEGLIANLRQGYESHLCQSEPTAFHALVLRLLAAHHQDELQQAVLRKLWHSIRDTRQAQRRLAQQALEAEFADLVRQSIRIHLRTPQRITGVRGRSEVYRVRFGLTTEAADEHGAVFSAPPDSLHLIVKTGPADALADAIERYRDLPEPLQKLFARHTHVIQGREWSHGYLIMEELTDMQPLSEVMGELDPSWITREQRQDMTAASATAVANVLRALHGYRRLPALAAHQFNLTYLAPMTEALNRLRQPGAFPELNAWLEGPLEVNGQHYRGLDWYLKQLARLEGRLSCTSVGFAHGDCHSRNLMLNGDRTSAVFVDIDTLTGADDYLADYGLLLEDVALYQSLPYGDEPGRLDWEDIQVGPADSPRDRLDSPITYPPFPQRSEAVVLFQQTLLKRLAEVAASFQDGGWKPRLWVAVARGLLLLASRQLTSHTVEPRRRSVGLRWVDDLKLVQVAYAEAVRLLHELYEHLDREEALPDLPFRGEQRPALAPGSENYPG